ncbi:MAG TPA: nucleotide exchange factor GrpE [Sphingomonadales bacterium]|nr:nucleotide exchange factor GrpE [Sphingomonadales bacterium]
MVNPKTKTHTKKHAKAHPQPKEAEAEKLKEEIAALSDKLLRALAEAENVRRRAEREVKDASHYAVTAFARDMVHVLDNLQRALKAVPDALKADAGFRQFVDGIHLTERELMAALERHGIRKISPQGAPFDHDRHQALFEVETDAHPKGHVAEVVQEGYLIKERLLRPALVGVAKAKNSVTPSEPKTPEGGKS